jgi:hypothetical protein
MLSNESIWIHSFFKKYQCGFLALAFVMMLVIGSGGDDEIKPDVSKNLRQAEPPAAAVVPQPQTNTNVEQNTNDYETADADKEYRDELAEEDLEIEAETAMEEIDEAEEEEIEINDGMLVSAVKSEEENLKFKLGKVLGSGEDSEDDEDATSADVKLSGEELEVISQEISEKLEKEVKTEFRARADEIAEEKIGEIDQVIAEDRDAGLDAEEVSVFKCHPYS